MENCQSPEPMTLAALLQLNWEEPTFSDNSGNVTVNKSQEVKGLTNGTTIITYKAQDPAGNFAYCSVNLTLLGTDVYFFPILINLLYFVDNVCMVPPMPRNTDVTCSSNEAETVCHVYCKPGFASRESNLNLTCKDAQWSPLDEMSKFLECSGTKQNKVSFLKSFFPETVSPDAITETGQILLETNAHVCENDENLSLITNQFLKAVNESINLKMECVDEESNTIWSPARSRRFAKKKRKINITLTSESI